MRTSVPLLLEGALLGAEPDTAREQGSALLALAKEGPDEEELSFSARTALVLSAAEKILRGRPGPVTEERWARMVGDWIEGTNDLEDLLGALKRSQVPGAVRGIIAGATKRLRASQRPLDVVRAEEVNRRRKLDPAERESLPALADWLADTIRSDPRLTLIDRRVTTERSLFERTLYDLASQSLEPAVLVSVLKAAAPLAQEAGESWAPLLIDLLDAEERAVSAEAFRLLKELTSQTLPQSSAAWRAWLASKETK